MLHDPNASCIALQAILDGKCSADHALGRGGMPTPVRGVPAARG
jgi:hypothetical protein